MPTGYTEKVQSGKVTSLKEFFFLCAHAFTSYDQPMDAKIPPCVDSEDDIERYETIINASLDRMVYLKGLSPAILEEKALKTYYRALSEWERYINERNENKLRYDAMMEKVKSWNPSPVVQNIKNFMINQLEESMKFDCADLGLFYPKPVLQKGHDWVTKELEKESNNIVYYSKLLRETKVRNKKTNAFLKAIHTELAKL